MEDYFADEFGSYGEEVDFIGEAFGGLDGCDVGVDEDCVDSFFFEGFDCLNTSVILRRVKVVVGGYLRSAVVEFACLADTQSSTSKNKTFLYVDTMRYIAVNTVHHILRLNLFGPRHNNFRQFSFLRTASHNIDKHIKQKLRVSRTRCGLRMKLNRKEGEFRMINALITSIIRIDKELLPRIR